MKYKCVYPFYTQWLILSDCNALFIVSKEKQSLVNTFDEPVLKIEKIKYTSCYVYSKTGYYYVNLESFVCIKKENKQGKLMHIGTLNESWDVYKTNDTKCIFAYNSKSLQHSVVHYTREHWIIHLIEENLVLIEADELGIYINDTCCTFPKNKTINVQKIENNSQYVILHGILEKQHILLLFCLKTKTFSDFFKLNDVIDFKVLNNNLILFYEYYFAIAEISQKKDFYTYDSLLNINNSKLFYLDDRLLHILNIETRTCQTYVIDYQIKHICENQNKEIFIIADDDSFLFI